MSLREWLLVGLLMVGSTLHGAGPAVMVEGEVSEMARDGDGIIWAVPKEDQGVIACLKGQRWVTHRVKEVRETDRAMNLFLSVDGDVICLWQNTADPESWTLTLHRGHQDRMATTFRGKFNKPRLWPGADGSTLLTERGAQIILFSADHAQILMSHVPDHMLLKPAKEPERPGERFWLPVNAAQDFDHSWWLWSPENEKHENAWRLGGMVTLNRKGDARRITRVNNRVTNKDAPIPTMVPWDEQHMAVAVAGCGILLVKTSDFTAVQQPMPEKAAFSYVEQIFKAGNDRYLIATPQPTETLGDVTMFQPNAFVTTRIFHYDNTQPADVLWRQHEGSWELVQRGLDEKPDFALQRPWLDTERGLLMVSRGGDPWLFPPGTEPQFRLSRAMGFPRGFIVGLCQADAEHALVLDSNGRSWLWPLSLRPAAGAPPYEMVTMVQGPLQGRNGIIWGLHAGGVYGRWDHDHWSDQPLPVEIAKFRGADFFADDRDQGWLFSRDDPSAKVGLLDLSAGTWRIFGSMHEALEAQLPKGIQWEAQRTPYCEYAFSGDGRIGGFLHFGEEVTLFEKGVWHHWTLNEAFGPQGRLGGSPFFSSHGDFSVPVYEGSIWQWTDGHWKRTEDSSVPNPLPHYPKEELDLGPGVQARTFHAGAAARDRWGVVWAIEDRSVLRKYLPGHDVSVFPNDLPQPLDRNFALRSVLVDDSGHVFVDYSQYDDVHHVLHIPPHLLLPQLEVALAENRDDKVRFKLGNKTPGETWYTWRLDHLEWQPVQTKPEVLIHPLPGGDHVLEVRAFNAELIPDPKTASVNFHVEFNGPDLTDHLLAQLVSGGEAVDRNEVARSLIGLGASVLPQIKAAREKAPTSSAQWWLDAVIQQIERQKK